MSRHSHWAKIKRGKGDADSQRAVLFTKLARLITVAAREGGGDAAFNFKLRLIIDRAKGDGMSKDAIERAIARGIGEVGGAVLETVLYEGIAPGGAGVLVECLTDNRNRALNAVKMACRDHAATLGGEGSVRWQFERRGVVEVTGPIVDDAELACIEAGAEDIRRDDARTVILTKPEGLQRVREAAIAAGLTVGDAGLEWIAKQHADVPDADRERFETFLAALDELDDVQDVYTNAVGY
jgi:YebC/PmpR family DNA-binding regulatory protein